ncbi:MAG: relaxase domain-containing protein, partial [Actinomycetota bacterium]|nr:relaxase domain-containing protein [Actinomycetota bacterium]
MQAPLANVTATAPVEVAVAWMPMMGADSVAYHEKNVAGRGDDHAGQALAYYGSRGETPLTWGRSGRSTLGVDGPVTSEAYRAVFGPGGARLPRSGAELVATRRPGLELVVSPPKSVALLGVIGRPEDMHTICDAERDATMAYLDKMVHKMVRSSGGRRGENQTRTKTAGLTWATSRHATTRAGDPQIHDHVLIANVVWMRDDKGGWKALDSAFVRDHLHAATAIGRLAAARRAVEFGYRIELDFGRSERLGGWQITGIPQKAMDVFSKRSREIDAKAGPGASYTARNVAARLDRAAKTNEPVADLVARWRGELAAAGFEPGPTLRTGSRRDPVPTGAARPTQRGTPGDGDSRNVGLRRPLTEVKVFDRADVIVAVAPQIYGHTVEELERAVDAVIADSRCIPLLGLAGARSQAYATAAVLAAEEHIAA